MWGQNMWGQKKTCGAKPDSKMYVPLVNYAGSYVGLQSVWGEIKPVVLYQRCLLHTKISSIRGLFNSDNVGSKQCNVKYPPYRGPLYPLIP